MDYTPIEIIETTTEVVTPVTVYTVPDEARTDFAAFSAFLDSIA